MSDPQPYMFVVGTAITVIFALIGVVWASTQKSIQSNADAIAKKASEDALKEAKSDFMGQLTRQQQDFSNRLDEINQRQNREIDWLKSEMDKIAVNINELRRENNSANQSILAQIQSISTSIAGLAK